jgi:hypothetical protein
MVLKLLFRKIHQKYVESFEMWHWRRMHEIIWTDRVKNEALHRVEDGTSYLR